MKTSFLAFFLSALFISSSAHSATYSVRLDALNWGDEHGETAAQISGVVFGSYDSATGIVTMNAGVTTFVYPGWGGLMYSDEHTNWSTGNDNYTADSYVCHNRSAYLNFCGSYYYGINGIDESSMDYSTMPGIRTLGGDDTADPDPQHVIIQGALYGTSVVEFGGIGGNLIMRTADWNDPDPTTPGNALAGIEMVYTVVPVPAALWLFGSALLGLVGIKRKN